ncbi:THUMP domain-containing class I SAM-dependent RNA methyltransferase [Nitrosomonas nitrosa]|uniref:THUMP domain-containing class I SAM-dependent RNA methyltransferase n=1 Tax=Nitrosomonas nitrosa TaxID=52442 RepID=UPI0023F6E4FC|nr:THUMP domain-containing protein [Nitrosomonas nitrosa]MCO6435280.1 class I SAM-dependent RNA methyltransferase [Nitrosomonas nitrosa]
MTAQLFFAPCPRGLEAVLADELARFGATTIRPRQGGVAFQGDWSVCYRANLESRVASRILWQVAHQYYHNEADIYHITHALPWQKWFVPDLSIRVDLAAIRSPLRSLDFATLRIKDAVCDAFRRTCGYRPNVDTVDPGIRIHGFLDAQMFTLYLDTSGEALFKRGLRKSTGEAPIRENLAAGILYLAGWQPGIPLLDPMCGSGTFLLEAAQMACCIAPGAGRTFAFERLSLFDAALWKRTQQIAQAQQLPLTPQPIFGSDLYGSALIHAHNNLVAAGLENVVSLKQANILEITAPAPNGIIVTNPPYGERIGDQHELAQLYPKLGDTLKKKFSGWKAYIFTADPALPKSIRLTATRRIPLFNGALECRLFEYKMVAGSMRKDKTKAKDTM